MPERPTASVEPFAGVTTGDEGDGRGTRLPAPTDGVVRPEGSAEDEGPTRGTRSAVTATEFRPGAEPRDVPPADLTRWVCGGENFVWIDLSEYAGADLDAVAESLALEPAAVRSTLAPWTPPRLDLFGEQFYVAATMPDADPGAGRVEAGQVDLLAGPGFLVSAHKRPLPFLEGALARARRNPELLHRSPAFMLYILLDELLGHYERLQEGTQQEVEVMEERALMDGSDAYLRDLVRFKRYAFSVGQLAEQHREILAAFLRPDFGWVPEGDVAVYFRRPRVLPRAAGGRARAGEGERERGVQHLRLAGGPPHQPGDEGPDGRLHRAPAGDGDPRLLRRQQPRHGARAHGPGRLRGDGRQQPARSPSASSPSFAARGWL